MKRSIAAAAAFATVMAAGSASAQPIQNIVLRNSFNPVGAGARGLGMGGAFIAVADDGTAVSFNPAGLAQLRRSEIALVGFGDRLTSTIDFKGVQSAPPRSRTQHGAPDFGGLSVPFEVAGRNLTVELAYQRSVDLFGRGSAIIVDTFLLRDFDIDEDGTVDFIGQISPEQSGAFHTASVAAGYQVTARLSLGAALNYWVASWRAQGVANFRQVVRVPGQPPDEFEFSRERFLQKQRFRALNLNVGLLLKYSRLSLGGVMRLPFTGDYELEETGRSEEFFPEETATDVENKVTSRLHWPRSVGFGVALRPFKGFTLAGDYVRSQWSNTFIEDVPGGTLLTDQLTDADGNVIPTFTNRNFFDLLPASQTFTINTGQLRGGAEYLVNLPVVIIPLRVGAFRDTSPVGQLNRQRRKIEGFTVGTGFNFSHLVLDVAYERRRSDGVIALLGAFGGRRLAGVAPPSESVVEERIVASLIYRFGGKGEDPLKRLFRFLFVGKEGE